ncbi:uncharacterized protein [Diadema antillarum]|uniref:uncharacterized protein isoform X1 n=1 Tax=Diadema antillarum TaxID=105358 RepID=UPI003A8B50E6
MALKENLENFLENYDNMTSLSTSLDGADSFEMEFTHLKQISQRYRTDKVYPTTAGESEINMRKNRYKDILPFDHSRYILSTCDGQEGSDYINANYLKGVNSDHAYLAAQGPLPHTVVDFWRMLWESNATIIVMACNEFEQGRHKCERYWVDEGEEHVFGDICVTQIRQQRVTKDFMIRTLKATKDKEEKIFNQFHYTAWPDHGVPTSVGPILEMIKLVREYQPEEEPPIVVHCSAGCGRTGTICVIDYVRNALAWERIDQNFSLYDIILDMRKQRHAIVQTKNQYELVHRAVVTLFQNALGIKPESKDDFGHNYENVQLRHDHHVEQPRMPPKPPSQSSAGEKRDSQSHNYVNCNITSKGVSMDAEAPAMPKLPSAPSRPSRGNDSPDGSTYANYHIGSVTPEASKPTQDGVGKQGIQGKPRQSPDARYQNSFQSTLLAFKDIESDCAGQPAPPTSASSAQNPASQTQGQTKPKLPQTAKPTVSKPQKAGKPGKVKPSLPIKPTSVEVGHRAAPDRSVSVDGTSATTNPAGKMFATRQDSNPASRGVGKEALKPTEKKEALKVPTKPARLLEKSKSESGDSSSSPGIRHGAAKIIKGGKGERPSQPPPRPPANPKPSLAKSSGDEQVIVRAHHDYEQVHFSPPPDKKDMFEMPSERNVRGSPTSQMDSSKETNIVRRKTDSSRKLSNGSVPSFGGADGRAPRKSSSDAMEYAYVQQPQSKLEQLLKSEEGHQKLSQSSAYAEAYSEVTGAPVNAPKAALRSSGVSDQHKPPEKPKRGESYVGNDSDYDLVGFGAPDPGVDPFNDVDGTYCGVGPIGVPPRGDGMDDDDEDVPTVPVRTAESYQLAGDDEKVPSAGGKLTNMLKQTVASSKDIFGQQQAKIATNTRGLFKRVYRTHTSSWFEQRLSWSKLGEVLKPEASGSHGNPSEADTTAKHTNINELLEKTLKDYPPTYKEAPVMYKEQDIGYPKRVANPRRPRSPPRTWALRPSDVRSAQVHL